MDVEQRHTDLEHRQFNSSLKATLALVREKDVIYVPWFYENKQPWIRKALHATRMASEVTGEEAVDGGPGRVQVSMEIKGTEQLM